MDYFEKHKIHVHSLTQHLFETGKYFNLTQKHERSLDVRV